MPKKKGRPRRGGNIGKAKSVIKDLGGLYNVGAPFLQGLASGTRDVAGVLPGKAASQVSGVANALSGLFGTKYGKGKRKMKRGGVQRYQKSSGEWVRRKAAPPIPSKKKKLPAKSSPSPALPSPLTPTVATPTDLQLLFGAGKRRRGGSSFNRAILRP